MLEHKKEPLISIEGHKFQQFHTIMKRQHIHIFYGRINQNYAEHCKLTNGFEVRKGNVVAFKPRRKN